LIIFILLSSILGSLEQELINLGKNISPYVLTVKSSKGIASATVVGKRELVTVGGYDEGENVRLETVTGKFIKGKVQGYDEYSGMVLIITNSDLMVPRFSTGIENGALGFVFGNSLGRLGLIGFGTIDVPNSMRLRITIPLNPGNNGAGVFDPKGRLIGIIGGKLGSSDVFGDVLPPNTLGLFTSSNIGVIIPVMELRRMAQKIEKQGSIRRAWLGVSIRNREEGSGVYVINVVKGSPAEMYGIKPGDIIEEVSGKKVFDSIDFRTLILSKGAGEKVALKVRRNNSVINIEVKLGENRPVIKFKELLPRKSSLESGRKMLLSRNGNSGGLNLGD